MVSKPSTPSAARTAAAQSDANRDTAIANQTLNMVNQTGPWGSINYDQTGTTSYKDAYGRTIELPTYTQTTNLSPSQQAIFDQSQAAQGNLAQIANTQTDFLKSYLTGGVDTSGAPSLVSSPNLGTTISGYNPAFSGQIGNGYSTSLGDGYNTSFAGAEGMQPYIDDYYNSVWDRGAADRESAEAAARATLANKGIREGSAAWNAEMERLARQNTDASLATQTNALQNASTLVGIQQQAQNLGNNALLAQGQFTNDAALNAANYGTQAQGLSNAAALAAAQYGSQNATTNAQMQNQARQQAIQEAYAARNQPLNEINSLMSGTQVASPGSMYGGTPQTGLGGTDYAGIQQANTAAQTQSSNSAMGGLFGLAGTLGSAFMLSDRRAKTDIQRVGTTDGGVPLYKYRYKDGGPVQIGVMADEVPHAAVMRPDGLMAVDYARVS